MKKYDLLEHTADVGVRAYGDSISECFENAAKGMFDIITDYSKLESKGEYEIRLKADDLEQLLVDWLSELLFLNSAENLVFGVFKVKIKDKSLSAVVSGENFDTSKHNIGAEIKAVTYHMIEVKKSRPFHVQVLFDI